MRKTIFCIGLILCLCFQGCSKEQENKKVEESQVEQNETVQDGEQNVSDQSMTVHVKVLVDNEGYLLNRDKEVVFIGEDIPDSFRIIDCTSKQIVYRGRISEMEKDDKTGESIKHGLFSDFNTPGTYYVEADFIGRSYPFEIGEDVEKNLFYNTLQNSLFEKKENIDVYEESLALMIQGMSLQYYTDLYDNDEKEHPDVLKEMNHKVQELLLLQKEDGSLTLESEDTRTITAYLGSMALNAKIIENMDKDLASQYKQAAIKSYQCLKRTKETTDSELFFAESALLMLTGEGQYLKKTTDYLSKEPFDMKEDILYQMGAIYYVSSEAKTDTKICAGIMKSLMEIAEQDAQYIKNDPFRASDNVESIFSGMFVVSFCNYVVPSDEYIRILENDIHFLAGRNMQANRYIGEDGKIEDYITNGRACKGAIIRFALCGVIEATK